VPVHSVAAAVEQDRSADPITGRGVEGAADCGWQRDESGLAALADHAENAVAVLLTEVGDVCAGGFEDPQAEQPEQAHQGEVVPVGRLPGCG